MFSHKNFIALSLTFGSLVHFGFIVMNSVTECSTFILSCLTVQFSLHHSLEIVFSPPCIFALLVRGMDVNLSELWELVMDREAWRDLWDCKESDMTERLN